MCVSASGKPVRLSYSGNALQACGLGAQRLEIDQVRRNDRAGTSLVPAWMADGGSDDMGLLLMPPQRRARQLFDWWQSSKPVTEKPAGQGRVGAFPGPHLILEELRSRVPRYLEDVDQGKLIYPACKRAFSDPDGDVRSVWDHTRLEAIRYLTMVPRPEFELLTSADRQIEMIEAYLLQRPHDETVIDFTGNPTTDFANAIVAGLNWLTHCAKLAGVRRAGSQVPLVISESLSRLPTAGGWPRGPLSVAASCWRMASSHP